MLPCEEEVFSLPIEHHTIEQKHFYMKIPFNLQKREHSTEHKQPRRLHITLVNLPGPTHNNLPITLINLPDLPIILILHQHPLRHLSFLFNLPPCILQKPNDLTHQICILNQLG